MGKKTVIQINIADSFEHDIEQMEQMIRERAYQRFLERGAEHGHAMEDWLGAEGELIRTLAVTQSQTKDACVAEIDVAGIKPLELELLAAGQQVLVRSQDLADHQPKVFRVFDFPIAINTDAVAEIDGTLLRLTAPKARETEGAYTTSA